MSRFFAYISRMKYIRRWGLMHAFREENVQEHSLQVAQFAHALALIENTRFGGDLDAEHIMAIAVYHETAEVITGDLVSPIKYYNKDIEKSFKEVEEIAEKKMLSMLPADLYDSYARLVQPEEKKEKMIVKAADNLAAYAKCLEEIHAGNMEFVKAKESIEKKLRSYELPSVKVFLEECMPYFSKTLDELNDPSAP